MVLAILTGSFDGTSNVLVELCEDRGIEVFRWNSDLWDHYEISSRGNSIAVTDPVGRKIDFSTRDQVVLWRKPFLETITWPSDRADRKIFEGQLRGFLDAAVVSASEAGTLRLIEPFAGRRLPKLRQVHDAAEYFPVPESEFSVQRSHSFGAEVVVKPLDRMDTADGKVLYSTLARADSLERPFPWFLQAPLHGGRDVTCVYIAGTSHFFACDFLRGSGAIDWRVEINSTKQSKWTRLDSPTWDAVGGRVSGLMDKWRLRYGRLDFIEADDGTLWFLECNTNGQFGWLDDASRTLHNEFLDAALGPDQSICVH